MSRRRPVRTPAMLLVLLVSVLVASTIGCTATDEPQTGGQAVSFQTELEEAERMVAEASAIAGIDVAPVHRNTSGGNIAGAPDPSTQRRDITVQWESAEPPPFAAVRDLWTGSFGYTVTSESADDIFLAKDEMRASISQGLAAPDGRRNLRFGVVTGLHPADEVPEPA